ncbi:MAG: PAS domain-containing protein [Cyanobacteriota bacterium]|nr:PAS domain-containing protein [Cyanobacteriota bacterium]
MWEPLKILVSPYRYIPHGHCYLWQTPLVALHALSDIAIALAYFSIPAMLAYFVKQRRDVPFSSVFLLFGAFITLCGVGHLLEVWTLWYPAYWLSGIEQAATAIVSCYTAAKLVELLPEFLATDAKLQRSEARLQLITDALPVCIAYIDRQQRYQFVNKTYENWFKLPPSQLLGQSVREIVGEKAYDIVRPQLHRVFNGKSARYEARVPYRLGGTRDIEEILVPDRDSNGEIQGYYALISDISDRKAAENALRESENRFRAIFNQTFQLVGLLDCQGTLLEANQTALDFVGVSREEVVGKPFWEARWWTISEETQTQLKRAIVRAAGGEFVRYEVDVLGRGDRVVTLDFSLRPVYNSSGELTLLLPEGRDMTERKRNRERLRRSETLLQTINQVLPLGIYVADRQGERIAYYNREFCRLWHLEAVVPQLEAGQLSHEAVSELCSEQLEPQSSSARPLSVRDDLQLVEDELSLQDGRIFRRFCVPVRDRDRDFGQLSLFEDISDRKRAEDQLRQLNLALLASNAELEQAQHKAEAASQAKSAFVAKMSHELRTPLNVILGFTQVLARNNALDDQQRSYLQLILRSGEHLLSLINDVLDLAKIESGKTELIPTSFDLHELLESLQQMLQLKAAEKYVQLNVERDTNLPQWVETDEGKLRQILINLLGNAIKFTQYGTVTLSVFCKTRTSGDRKTNDRELRTNDPKDNGAAQPPTPNPLDKRQMIGFQVQDTGCGIPPEDLERIFEAFNQSEAGRHSPEGTGLGLSISQYFVELMNGTIQIESTPGRGTTVTFEISVLLPHNPEPLPKQQLARPIALAPNQPTPRILLAEDCWENRQVVIQLLLPFGFEIWEANNAREAIALWQKYHPQLIFMDLQMPAMDGYEAVRQIRSLSTDRAPVIIALTASAPERDRDSLLKAGCDDVLRKPVKEKLLLDKIAQYLGVRYSYETLEPLPTPSGLKSTLPSAEMLLLMPQQWANQLNSAAARCEEEDVRNLLEQIPPGYLELRQHLNELVENYRFDRIFQLTEPLINP